MPCRRNPSCYTSVQPRHPQAADPGLAEVERAPRPVESRLQSQVGALPPDAQGNRSTHGEIRADSGKHHSGREGQVGDHPASHMALPSMGPGKLTDNMSGAVAFKVTVGLRSPQCQTLYAAFAKLAGLSILQLIAANMHKERQKHGREAEEVRNLTWRYGSGSRTQVALTHATSIPPF